MSMLYVPVVDSNHKPLMPTTANRAASWIKSRKATPFWKAGIFCVRLNVDPSDNQKQDIAVGVDPGSKKEGFCVKSESSDYLNIQSDTPFWVKGAMDSRRDLRKSRHYRKGQCRANRSNRGCLKEDGRIPPSTKARWDAKLRILNILRKIFPISAVIVEDINAITKEGKRKWNASFSPLEVGKKYFYAEIRKFSKLILREGYENSELRKSLGLNKLTGKGKVADSFDAHCVDAWVMVHSYLGGHLEPKNTSLLCLKPLKFHRRQLHVTQPAKGGIRKSYGSTRSMGFKRGSIVKHKERGLCLVGGTSKGLISLNYLSNNKRITQDARIEDCRFRAYNSWAGKFLAV